MLWYTVLYFFGFVGAILLIAGIGKSVYWLSVRAERRIGDKAHYIVPGLVYVLMISTYVGWLTTKLKADPPNIYNQISDAAQKKDRAEVLRLVKMLEAGHLSGDQPR